MNPHSTTATSTIFADRFHKLKQKHQPTSSSSIETNVSITTTNSIELPQEITSLITGSPYWVLAKTNRYKKLIREGHLAKLLELATMAKTKDNPANWFAKACSKAAWERTLAYFAKLSQVAQKAERVAQRLGTNVSKFIYQQIWQGVNVERWAAWAQEMPHTKPGQSRERHFVWLCLNERFLTTSGCISSRYSPLQ